MYCCLSEKQLDDEYKELGLRHEDVATFLMFTAGKDIRIDTENYMNYAFKPWKEYSKLEKYQLLEYWKKIPEKVQHQMKTDQEIKM